MDLCKTLPLFTAALAIGTSASAATISWTAATAPTAGSFGETLAVDFDDSGTFILAEDSGASTGQTYDGINFAAGDTASTALTLSAGWGNFSGPGDNFHAGDQVSDSGLFTSSGADTLALDGLLIGATYRVQILLIDGRSNFAGRTATIDGTNVGQYANGVFQQTYGDGVLATGTFVADATTQAIDIDVSAGGSQLNAITVFQTEVPEPGSLALLGLGGLLIARRRR